VKPDPEVPKYTEVYVINFYSLINLLGVPSKVLEEKMDRILNLLRNQNHNLQIEENRSDKMLNIKEEI